MSMIYEKTNRGNLVEPIVYVSERDENLEPGVRYGPVIRDIYVVECCTGGYGSVIINQVEYPVKQGDCYILLPGDVVVHTADRKEPRRGVWCMIDGPQIGKCMKQAGITARTPFAPPEAFEEIRDFIEQMIGMKGDGDNGANYRKTACVYGILGALLRGVNVTADKNLWIEKAVGIMEAKYDQDLSVARLADEVGLERSYFSTLFKAGTGMSPHAYLTELRIKKACIWMRYHEYSIGQAAAAVGLDPQNFARLFKQQTGMTPGEYRKVQNNFM